MDRIRIRGARENNLKNLDLDLPRGRLVVISGLSGSGKSSLLFDTLYAEGQRRYVESLSTYTRQFLERLRRPDLDSLEGIGPAVAIRQRNSVQHSRSTVATYTEIADFLRVLFARAGTLTCPGCGRVLTPDPPSELAAALLDRWTGRDLILAFPLAGGGLAGETLREILQARGFTRIVAGGRIQRLDGAEAAGLADDGLLVIVDRLRLEAEARGRLAEGIEAAYREGEGRLRVLDPEGRELGRWAEGPVCPDCELRLPEPTPAFFSFQHADGACPDCRGYGNRLEFDLAKIIPDPTLSLEAGALAPWASERFEPARERLRRWCADRGVSLRVPFAELPEWARADILEGGRGFRGLLPWLRGLREKSYKKYARFFSRRYMTETDCPTCGGSRLRPEVEQVRLDGWTLPAFYRLSLGEAGEVLAGLDIDAAARGVERVIQELAQRLRFLDRMGLHYLGLDRLTRTLSGGEFQRIHLANALGSHLTDTLYALDEPTVGLHPRDTRRLLDSLRELRDMGNSVIVVEHDPEVIRGADELVDLGPGSGAKGGSVVYQGTPDGARGVGADHPSPTLRFLAGIEPLSFADADRRASRGRLRIEGVTKHNLRDLDVEFPLGQLVCVSGVSGSGKSTLVADVLVSALRADGERQPGDPWRRLRGAERIHAVSVVDQSPIGKSPRSNPATYIGAFQFIRALFAEQPEARQRRLGPDRFSFNSPRGACPECKGLGSVKLEMVFMADLYVPCEACGGSRFRPESLEVRYKGRTIAEVLDLTVDEAIHFFAGQHALGERLWMLHRVGLGYLKLGQGASTLSGGESQRLKIARELARAGGERNLYVLDEPTTGLHPLDVRTLLAVFRRLLKAGHSLLVIEHNLQVLLAADHLIDLGPEGGDGGGRVVAAGTPAEVAATPGSITGAFLAPYLGGRKRGRRSA
ncbi:MAG: excinuclease ABC subunit UvrA [Candidatus Krumholzibacteriota bacterium]|nr:excinuclease ABC subunit UvrA [Candidatus Krumholzibacteriota bacterium]